MSREGFISISRKLLEWQWYHKPNMVPLWVHLLLSANYKQNTWQNITIERGQLVTGLHSLHKQTGISVQSLRTCLERLKSTGEITIESTNSYSIITICKYDSYQFNENKSTNESTITVTNDQQTINKRSTTINKVNKNNKVNKVYIYPSELEVVEYFKLNGYPEEVAKKAFNFYNSADWKDSKGKKVLNWKQKMIGVWFKEENKNIPAQKDLFQSAPQKPVKFFDPSKD